MSPLLPGALDGSPNTAQESGRVPVSLDALLLGVSSNHRSHISCYGLLEASVALGDNL
jgi:hypothetical protein